MSGALVGASWAWALGGILLLLVLGLAVMVALGLVGTPGDLFRRAGQTAAAPRTEDGRPLPDEVPDRTPAEAAEEAADVERPER